MLIINGVTRKSRTEQQVVEWLSNYITHPGVAVSGVHVPDSRGLSTEADFVVFTPYAAAVIGVEGLRKKAGGMLMCSMNERWSIVGTSLDPVRVRPGDLNPLHRVREPASALKNLAASRLGRESFVDGLVLLIPFPNRTVRLDRGPLAPGFNVLLGDSAAQLYSWLNRTAQHRPGPVWTAGAVLEILTALRVDDAGTTSDRLFDQLVGEGFPTGVPGSHTVGPAAAAPPAADAVPAQAPALHSSMPETPSAVSSAAPAPQGPATATAERPTLPIRTPGTTWETTWPSPPNRRAELREIPSPRRPESQQTAPPDTGSPTSAIPVTPLAPTPGSTEPSNPTTPPATELHSAPGPFEPAPHDHTEPAQQRLPEPTEQQRTDNPLQQRPAPAPTPDAVPTSWEDPQDSTRPPRHRMRTALLTAAAIVFLACGFWAVTGNEHARAQTDRHPPPTSRAVHSPAEHIPPPASEVSRSAPVPRLFPEEKTCYPFQPQC